MDNSNEKRSQLPLSEALYDGDYPVEERRNVVEKASDQEIVDTFLDQCDGLYNFDTVKALGFNEAYYTVDKSALTTENPILVANLRAYLISSIVEETSDTNETLQSYGACFDELVKSLIGAGFLEEPTADSVKHRIESARASVESILDSDDFIEVLYPASNAKRQVERVDKEIVNLEADLKKLENDNDK